MNQFGSRRRMEMALETSSLDEIAGRIQTLMEMKSPEGMLGKLKMLPTLAEVGKYFPKVIPARQAACKEVIQRDGFNVLDFPVLQCWPMDGGRFITLPLVITRDPRHGKRNMGMYRMQVYDAQTTGMHWQRQKVAAEHFRERLRMAAAAKRDRQRDRRTDGHHGSHRRGQHPRGRQYCRDALCDNGRSARRADGGRSCHRD